MVLVIRKKYIIIGLMCCILLIALPFAFARLAHSAQQTVATAAANTNWGLGFKENGKQPTGNASPEYLKQYQAYYVGSADKKVIYLTFDAGYEAGYTPTILDTLKKHKVKAAFFVVGTYVKSNPELVKRMLSDGHIVGNHTYTHPDMSKISDMDAFKKEMTSVEEIYKQTTGQEMQKFYRPPQGKYCESNLKQANELGYHTIFWSLAYVDWYKDKQPTKEQAFAKLLPRIHPGAVVLLHSTSKTNSEILDELLTKWEGMGYTFGTLHDLCGS